MSNEKRGKKESKREEGSVHQVHLLQKQKPPIILNRKNNSMNNNDNNNTNQSSPDGSPQLGEEHAQLDECNVFVKYLPQDVDDAALREMFQKFGTIISCKVMIDSRSGGSLGFGFVRFSNANDAREAITKMNGFQIANKTLLCKLSNVTPNTPPSTSTPTPTTPSNPFTSSYPQNQPSLNLYVKNLPVHHREEQLRALFAPFGEILDVKVMVDKNTGESRQIGFVRYLNQQDATQALNEMNGYVIDKDEMPLTVRYAETEGEKLVRKHRQNQSRNQSNRSPARQFGYTGEQQQQYYQQPILTSVNSQISDNTNELLDDDQEVTRYTSQIPTEEEESVPYNEEQGYLYSASNNPQSMEYFQQPFTNTYMPPYDAYNFYYQQYYYQPNQLPLSFQNMSLNSQPIPGASPSVIKQSKRKYEHGNISNNGESTSTILQQSQQVADAGANLFVFHLPSDIDDTGLYSLFVPFGTIESIKVITDAETGESKGYGFVKYYLMSDAIRAIEAMNGYQVGRKHLKVSFKTSGNQLLPSNSSGQPNSSSTTSTKTMSSANVVSSDKKKGSHQKGKGKEAEPFSVSAQNFPALKQPVKIIPKPKNASKRNNSQAPKAISPNSMLTGGSVAKKSELKDQQPMSNQQQEKQN